MTVEGDSGGLKAQTTKQVIYEGSVKRLGGGQKNE